MERNPAACAMEWSMELEKGLRSKAPLRRAQAITEFGPRLLQWSREPQPQPSPAGHQLFDLIPGEDRLFANALLLRLAEAFRLGDCKTRVSIANVFLAEYRDRAKRRGGGSLLSKERVSNPSELLGRVKAVFDYGDVQSRSLALCLFGCWADFAAESPHIRYLVLSTMVSPHVSEVKAALFAAGCLCEVSHDFPCVVLQMLENLMTSSETLPPIKLAAARAYAKMGNSFLTATKAYKTGLKLVLDSSDEDYQAALLVSLSKISSRSSILIPSQVDLLFSLLNQEKTLRVRATALRCLLFIFSKGVCQLSVVADLIKVLINMLDEPKLPTKMHCGALRILRKIILYMQPGFPYDILYLDKLTAIAEKASLSSFMSTGPLALYVLVDISKRCQEIRDKVQSQIVLLIVRRIASLASPLIDQDDSLKFQEIKNMLNLLLSVVQENQDLVLPALDQIVVIVRYVGITSIALKLLCNVYSFLVICLECLDEADAITVVVFDKVKLIVEAVCESKSLDCYVKAIYAVLLHSPAFWGHNINKNEERCNLEGTLVEREVLILELAKKILLEKNWTAYKVGTHLAYQGAWFSSSLIFQHLIPQVHSESCCRWLRLLYHFASSGRQATLLFLTEKFSSLADMTEATKLTLRLLCNDSELFGHDGSDTYYKTNGSKVVESAYKSICLAKAALEVELPSSNVFCFQRWFLSLRAKTLRAVVDVLETLENIPCLFEKNSREWQREEKMVVESMISLGQVSLRLERLAKEFNLLNSSFIDMDDRSSKLISAIALSISLLAVGTAFSFFVSNLPEASSLKSTLCAHLVQNLAGRLWYIDYELSTKLCQLIDVGEYTNITCIHLRSGNQAFNVGSEARNILSVCGYIVSEISHLRSEAERRTHGTENASRVIEDGLKLTLKVLVQWMQIPFRIPEYFFRVRPGVGSELFAVSINRNLDAISVLPGYHLPLSVCIQLRNVPSDLHARPAKLYGMLYCSVSFQEPRRFQQANKQSGSTYQAWETDDMVEMNEKLLQHVKNCAAQNINYSKSSQSCNNDVGFRASFVCCEPNEIGQGLGNCLLDVSGFPPGSYRIKWQSCCIDTEGDYWNLLPLNPGPVFTIE